MGRSWRTATSSSSCASRPPRERLGGPAAAAIAAVPSPPDRLTLAAFVTLIVIGGGASVAIRVSNQELPPFRGAAPRFAAASIVFAVMTAAARLRAA